MRPSTILITVIGLTGLGLTAPVPGEPATKPVVSVYKREPEVEDTGSVVGVYKREPEVDNTAKVVSVYKRETDEKGEAFEEAEPLVVGIYKRESDTTGLVTVYKREPEEETAGSVVSVY